MGGSRHVDALTAGQNGSADPFDGTRRFRAVLAICGILTACLPLLLGPLGWFTLAALAFLLYPLLTGNQGDDSTPDKTNCPACGARDRASNAVCRHCEERL